MKLLLFLLFTTGSVFGQCVNYFTGLPQACSGSGSPAFSVVTAGTNPNALLVSGSLAPSGAGTISATSLSAIPTLCSAGNAPLGILANGNATGCASIGSGVPGGLTTQIQFNNAGAFSGNAGFVWDPAFPGLSLTLFNPTQGNDANDRRIARLNCTTDSATSNPNFSNQNCLEIVQTILNGQATNGGGTNAKTTFEGIGLSQIANGSGQRILLNMTQTAYGMSDSGLMSINTTYSGAPVNGDECNGCFSTVSYSQQQTTLTQTSISSVPAQTTCNTTTTQAVTASKDAQLVTVASSTNCNIGNYVVIDQEVASGSPILEAVKITASAAGSISGIFRYNHLSGVTVKPATVLAVADTSKFGQDRVLVNLTASAYTTGTVASITGGGFAGSGTTWTTGMVGGGATAIGCVALTNDDYTGAPFGAGAAALKSWYQITTVGSTTGLSIFTYSVAGDAAYRGNGVGAGAYTIRPCARVLTIESSAGSFTGNVILENNSFIWTAADSVELAISPYPDVQGYQYQMKAWTPGGTYRSFMTVINSGARTFQNGIALINLMPTGGGADTTPWLIGYYVDKANTGFSVGESLTGNAYVANATNRNTTTKRPGYTFAGGALAGGMYGDADTGVLSVGVEPSSLGQYAKITLDNTPTDNKGIVTAVGHFTIDGGRAGSSGPITTIKMPSSLQIQMSAVLYPTSETDGLEYAIATNYFNTANPPVRVGAMFGTSASIIDGANTALGAFGASKAGVSTSAATNAGSNLIWYNSSVWTGSVAANRWMFNRSFPGHTGNNASVEWQVGGLAPTNSYNHGSPSIYFGVNDQGIVRFGQENIQDASPLIMASLDPTSLTANRLFKMPDMAGTFSLILKGTTGSIGGGLLTAGACATGTATVTGATTAMTTNLPQPATYPGDGFEIYSYVSASNTVTVKVCALVALTPTASTYSVSVNQ